MNRRFIDISQFFSIYSMTDSGLERIVLMLGAEMGIRRNEMTSLKLSDIFDGKLRISGKGHGGSGKEVTKTIPEGLLLTISEYIGGERNTVMTNYNRDHDFLLVRGMKSQNPG